MGLFLIGIAVGVCLTSLAAVLGCVVAYQNGATDGYGYAQEPNNPGYQRAGGYLKATMAHQWAGLRPDKPKFVPPPPPPTDLMKWGQRFPHSH